MTAFQFLKEFPYLPVSIERPLSGKPSNSEKRRWLTNKAVLVNGVRPTPDEEIKYHITELVFFPRGKRKTTMV